MLRIFKIILFLLITITVQVSAEKYLYPVVDGSSVGYIDSSGTVVIKIDYFPEVKYVNNRVAGVTVKKFILPRNAYFSEGFASTMEPIRWAFIHWWSDYRLIDTDGNLYDLGSNDYVINRFKGGVAPIKLPKKFGTFTYGYSWGFINKSGNILSGAAAKEFQYASEFSEGVSLVLFNNLFGFVKPNGDFLIKPLFENAEPFSEGLAQAMKDTLWGYIDTTGKFVIPSQFAATWEFSGGFARVMKNPGDLQYYIDRSGKRLGKYAFADCSNFSEGLAAVQYEGKYGFIDTTGNFAVKADYIYAGEFHNGLAPVGTSLGWGFIDRAGKWVIKPDYDYVEAFDHKLALAWEKGELYYINTKGVQVYHFIDFNDNSLENRHELSR